MASPDDFRGKVKVAQFSDGFAWEVTHPAYKEPVAWGWEFSLPLAYGECSRATRGAILWAHYGRKDVRKVWDK